MQPPPGDDGAAHVLISRDLVRLMRGSGPAWARTTIDGDLVVCVMDDTLTHEEQSLVAHGYKQDVLDARHDIQHTLHEAMAAVVEKYTRRKVVAFMSDSHIDPDVAAEVFILGAA
jgi:uncharacterized protein YbcI